MANSSAIKSIPPSWPSGRRASTSGLTVRTCERILKCIIAFNRRTAMKLTQIVGPCIGDSCPAIYRSDQGTIVVQGATVDNADGVVVPGHESLVEIPLSLLEELIRSGAVA